MKQKPIAKKEAPVAKQSNRSTGVDLFLLAGAIVIVTFFCFSPALKASFINWDDNAYVFENTHLNEPVPKAIAYFFDSNYFVGNYIPLTMMTFVLEYHSAKLKPGLYHMVNVLFHLANVLLVFWFIYLLSGRKPIVAGIVAILFGIHPMHVESVAWISELKDVQYTFFFLAGLITYYYYVERRSKSAIDSLPFYKKIYTAFPTVPLLLFVLSVLSKPAAVVFPLVLLLLDFYNRRKFNSWVWIEKIPFLIVSVIFGIIAIKSQDAHRLLRGDHAIWERLLFASHSFVHYLFKLILPTNLAIFYPYPRLVDGHLPVTFYIAPLVVIALFFIVFRTLKQTRLIVFGFLFYVANIILVLQLLSVGDAIMADRYTYVAYIGLFFVLAMNFEKLYNGRIEKFKVNRSALMSGLVIVLLLCSVYTYARCRVWKNEESLADDLVTKFPEDYLAVNNKGFILFEHENYAEAINLFTKAIQLKPDYVRAYINLAQVYMVQKDLENAWKTIDTALKHVPKDHFLLMRKANLLYTKGDYLEASKYFSESIVQNEKDLNTYINLAETYYRLNNFDAGIKTLEHALMIEPDNYTILNNKGYFLYLQRHYKEAIVFFNASLRSKPDYKTANANLEVCEKALNDSLEKTH